MPRPKYDKKTMQNLLSVLVRHPDGIWLSKLAREADVPVSTTAYYLSNQISMLVEEQTFGEERDILRVVKLKPFVLEKLEKGSDLRKIMKMLKIMGESG